MPRPLSTEVLNLIYVAATRSMDELDPNTIDELLDSVEELKEKRKGYQETLKIIPRSRQRHQSRMYFK